MLGVENPYEMMDRMDERVFRGWRKFWSEEPFGPMVQNMMAARIAAACSGGDEDSFLPCTVAGE